MFGELNTDVLRLVVVYSLANFYLVADVFQVASLVV